MHKVYKVDSKIGYLPSDDTDTIARFITGLIGKSEEYLIVDDWDILIVAISGGGFVKAVNDKHWYENELLPRLYHYQEGGTKHFEKVQLISESDYHKHYI